MIHWMKHPAYWTAGAKTLRQGQLHSLQSHRAQRVNNVFIFTLWHLRGQRGGDGDKVKVTGSIVHWHLSPLATILSVSIALIHELVKRETSPQQHSCTWQNSSTPAQVHSKMQHDITAVLTCMTKQLYSCSWQNSSTIVHDKTAVLL